MDDSCVWQGAIKAPLLYCNDVLVMQLQADVLNEEMEMPGSKQMLMTPAYN